MFHWNQLANILSGFTSASELLMPHLNNQKLIWICKLFLQWKLKLSRLLIDFLDHRLTLKTPN